MCVAQEKKEVVFDEDFISELITITNDEGISMGEKIDRIKNILNKFNIFKSIKKETDIDYDKLAKKVVDRLKTYEVLSGKPQKEDPMNYLRKLDFMTKQMMESVNNLEKETTFEKFEESTKGLEKTYFQEAINQTKDGIRLLKHRRVNGKIASILIDNMEFSLRMAILYSKVIKLEPKYEERCKKYLKELKNL